MNAGHLEILAKTIDDAAKEAKEQPLQRLVQTGGSLQKLQAYQQTPFLGFGPRGSVTQLYSLAVSLRRWGCPMLAFKGDALRREDYPGDVWITVRCTDKKARLLQTILAELEGFDLHSVGGDVHVLVGQNAQALPSLVMQLRSVAMELDSQSVKAEEGPPTS